MQQKKGGQVQGHMSKYDSSGSRINKPGGRYNEDFSTAPSQNNGESAQAYAARLKEWQRRRSMSGSAMTTGKKSATTTKTKDSSGNFVTKILDALK